MLAPTVADMSLQLSARILYVLTVVLAATLVLLGFSDSHATGVVGIVGSLILGVLWTVRGVFSNRRSSKD